MITDFDTILNNARKDGLGELAEYLLTTTRCPSIFQIIEGSDNEKSGEVNDGILGSLERGEHHD